HIVPNARRPRKKREKEKERKHPAQPRKPTGMARPAGTRQFLNLNKKKSPNEVPIEAKEIPIDQSTTNPILAPAQSQPQRVGHPPNDIKDHR
ncbi:hypothetical protein IscW_ISCW007312, partial [Ixodes scapularis]